MANSFPAKIIPEWLMADFHKIDGVQSAFERGDLDALDEKLDALKRIYNYSQLQICPESTRLRVMVHLGQTYLYRYWITGQVLDLNNALDWLQSADKQIPSNSKLRANCYTNLGNGSLAKYQSTTRIEDLELAITYHQQSIESTLPEESQYLSGRNNNLGNCQKEVFYLTGRLEFLEASIVSHQNAVEKAQPGSSDQALFLNNLGSDLIERYGKTKQMKDITRAITALRQSVTNTSSDSTRLAVTLTNLGKSLITRYIQTKEIKDLYNGIEVCQQAVEKALPNSLAHISALFDLGTALRLRYDSNRYEMDFLAAKCQYKKAAYLGQKLYPKEGLRSAFAWGYWAMERESWDEAQEAFQLGSEIANQIYSIQLTRSNIEIWMGEFCSLPSLTAYSYTKTGELGKAVEVLEENRARFLRETLEVNLDNLAMLQDIGQSVLYEEFMEARCKLQRLIPKIVSGQIVAQFPSTQSFILLEEMQKKIREITGKIREIKGYEDFLIPATYKKIMAISQYMPLIFIIVTPAGGLALVVTSETITPLWLEKMKEEALREKLGGSRGLTQPGGYLGVYGLWRKKILNQGTSKKARTAVIDKWHKEIDHATHWLWEAGMGEVVQCLREKGCSQAVLIPGGMLGLLPLHAAWTEDNKAPTGRRYALDDICFSYAPSAHALQSAQQGADRPMDRLLAVDNPDGSLHFSQEEVDTAVSWFQAEQVCRLVKEENTLERVKEEMGQANVLHFSTHGIAGFDEPLESFLLMAGEDKLTLREILEMDLENARLAILSACETGIPGTKLPDEVISLPTGLIQAGVPGVIGSLWSVSDVSTMLLVGRFYDLWQAGKGKEAAEALRGAQIWLRDTTNEEKKAYLKAVQSGGVKVRIAEGTVEVALTEMLLGDPKERSFAHPFHWAAFGFTGV